MLHCITERLLVGRYVATVGVLALCLAQSVLAAPPVDADPKLAPWFEDLVQPKTHAPCCSIADCRPVISRQQEGHYEAQIDGVWRTIPDSIILNRTDNPTGHAIACWTPNTGVILCFVPPPES
jgi:hypothetical protein